VSRAIVTFATGQHERLLDIARPSFEAFADRHGYDLLEADIPSTRPPSWRKVAALRAALQDGYEEALWLDADTVIVDASEDMDVPSWAWQALVRHHTGDGDVPNCGVWLARTPMLPVLEQLWGMTEWLHDGFWEQAAMLELLGFSRRPARLADPTDLYEHTFWLDHGWNYHLWDTPGPQHVRIGHATMHPDRKAVMRDWAAGVVAAPLANCGHRYPIQRCLCERAVV
jgi:hypothetical protein